MGGHDPGPPGAPDRPLGLLAGRRILLTVTGGVAAYKAAELARLMAKAGALVRVAMTEAARRFVAPLTFSSLTGQPVATGLWDRPGGLPAIPHVAWSEWAELLVTAPATADFLAKLAHGLADDLPSSLALAYGGPRLHAPAMNAGMFLNPATADNLATLRARGHRVLGSPEGPLACGTEGPGRMAEPGEIALEAARLLAGGRLSGRRVVVTGGATREAWDDIRFLSNRSSGLMGRALAEAAWLMGAETLYLAGPAAAVPVDGLDGLSVARAETTADLLGLAREALPGAWALLMNAAPADFAPETRASGKISKTGGDPPVLRLRRTPDILSSLSPLRGRAILVGFAAEEADLEARAADKLRRKGLDYVAANQAGGPGSAFGSGTIALTLLSARGGRLPIGPGTKFRAAWELLSALASGWE
jgi:phosphopantothenoylcysteine decarboxylase/phosphopantothenate--cysteine ligase